MRAAVNGSLVAVELVDRLRRRADLHDVTFLDPPAAITGGYDTAIFSFRLAGAAPPWDAPLILRLFRPEYADRPRIEAAVQNAVADMGYPCPRVLLASAGDAIAGRPFIIMERVEGRQLIRYITTPSRMTLRVTPILADAHARLHGIDVAALRDRLSHDGLGERDLEAMTFDAELADVGAVIASLTFDSLREALGWLVAHRPPPAAEVFCHGDFRPVNIMLRDDGQYAVVDWTLARFAEPEYDIARSVILWRRAPIDRTLVSGPLRVLLGIGRRTLLWRYRRLYRALRPIDAERLRWYEAFDALRVVALTLVGRNTTLWRAQPVIDGLMDHVRQNTGLRLGGVPIEDAAYAGQAIP
jgi:aminoglycoside phosphotransferase (APT) family kinase protein